MTSREPGAVDRIEDVGAPSPGGGGTLAPIEDDGLHKPTGRVGLGLALTLTTVAFWATLPIGLKLALAEIDPMTITWYRFSCAALILGGILAARGTLPKLGRLRARTLGLLGVAAACLSANYGLYVLGLHHTNAGTAQVVIQIAPVLFTLGGIFLFRERFRPQQWLGLALLVVGMATFSRDQIAHMVSGLDRYYVGLAFMVGAAVSWALYAMAQKQLLVDMSSPSVMLCIYVCATLIFFPLADPTQVSSASPSALAGLAFCVVNMLAAYGTFAESLVHWQASRVSALLTVVPLATLAMVALATRAMPTLLAPEPITMVGVVGACLVVTGSLFTALGGR
jgi:drug/metabolite transporter (DMT)-like permease